MEDHMFLNELECLKASYNSSEFEFLKSSNSPILKFNLQNNISITFQLPSTYPQNPPSISISSTKLTNSERSSLENEIKELASKSLGFPMIMDLVIKMQHVIDDFGSSHTEKEKETSQDSDAYIAIILIDHMRLKKKYSSILSSWASELHLNGCLLFYQQWIFLLLQGSKKYVKEFVTRHRTVCVDVDSTGKPCKEKMSRILYDGTSLKHLSRFFVKDLVSAEEMESYFVEYNLLSIYKDVIKPILNKNKS